MDDQAREQQIQTIVDQLWRIYEWNIIEHIWSVALEHSEYIIQNDTLKNHRNKLTALRSELLRAIQQDLESQAIDPGENVKVVFIPEKNIFNIILNFITSLWNKNEEKKFLLSQNSQGILLEIKDVYQDITNILIYNHRQ